MVINTYHFQVLLYIVPGERNSVEHNEVAFTHQLSGNNLCYNPIGLYIFICKSHLQLFPPYLCM